MTVAAPAVPVGPPRGSSRPPAWQIAHWGFRPIPFMERNRRAYGDVFPVDFGPQGVFLFIADPDIGREVFTAPADVLHPGEGARPVFEPLLGKRSILVLDGSDHLTQRKLMLPAFHGDRMRNLTGLMEEVAASTVGGWPRGRPFPLHEQMQAATLEIILRAVFGLAPGPKLDRLREVLSQLLAREVGALSIVRGIARARSKRPDELRDAADAEVYPLIDERLASGHEDRDDVLGMLLAARDPQGERMTREELHDELMTLLVAGHETTASSLAWCFEQLLRHPEVVARARAAAADDDTAYLDALVKETLRRRPVLPIAQPRIAKQRVTIGGRVYEPGIAFAVCIYLIHHRADLYPDPYAFRPERFLDGSSPGGYSWIPFGGGVRRCLGAAFAQLEMRIVLRAILSAVSVSAAGTGLERTRRRSITVSPRRAVPVVVADNGA